MLMIASQCEGKHVSSDATRMSVLALPPDLSGRLSAMMPIKYGKLDPSEGEAESVQTLVDFMGGPHEIVLVIDPEETAKVNCTSLPTDGSYHYQLNIFEPITTDSSD